MEGLSGTISQQDLVNTSRDTIPWSENKTNKFNRIIIIQNASCPQWSQNGNQKWEDTSLKLTGVLLNSPWVKEEVLGERKCPLN